MDDDLQRIFEATNGQSYGQRLGMHLLELDRGYARVELLPSEDTGNIFGTVHGGVIFSLLDQAFGAAANSHGTVYVALNVSVNYLRPARVGEPLYAEAREINRSRRVSTYQLEARNRAGELIATAQATAYGKGDRLPFLD
ncbi:MAG: hypothetical protein A4E45_01952 [Methanosaeta sp. PtaB.Bin039]|nr:MAG: hypothetical protein A4E45_01952 [Methanosaeta sp. PtaB.Bin039]HOT07676.1 PaaI family thioesterase [Methanotrichaceae archaeon]HQF17523.1 PaaI family thioesterase [Methanotrichaceae archaeon]HQI92072.1 PaaI family thioesterase [Methanotrichaceae archaeon]HQJ29311.1 PaaI family thioesterase [Methanotrichaceae archaeon]